MKIVINDSFGGFALSREAVLLARQISGDDKWGGTCIRGDHYRNGAPVKYDYGCVDVQRNDPILVRVVEELGPLASNYHANLVVREIPKGTKYRIQEYDGLERVETEDDIEWAVAF